MENIVTLNQLLDIVKTVTNNAKIQNDYNQLIDEYICNRYNILDYKKKLCELFSKFKSAKYLYKFPIEENIKTTPIYEERLGFTQRSTSSQVDSEVEHYIDKMLFTTEIYNTLIKVSYKLTIGEAIYLVNTFLTHKSEDDIAEIIGISKTYLQKIKKSCIVKMWTDFNIYCENDN